MKQLKLILAFIVTLPGFQIVAQQNPGQQMPKDSALVLTPQMTRQLLDGFGKVLVNNYIFPDKASNMVAYLDSEYQKGSYSKITDPRQLADRWQNDLQSAHHDGHLRFMYDPGIAQQSTNAEGEGPKIKINDAMELAAFRQKNFLFNKAEVLSGNIGYVAFNGFTDYVEQAKPTFSAAFRFVANTKALIIDLRNNGGGSPRMVNQVESYFFPEKVRMNDIVDKSSITNFFWADPAQSDGLTLSMPVYILTSKQTFSGAEDFTYAMQAIKRAIVVGDSTGGGAHPTGTYSVGMGFTVNIPNLRSSNPYTHKDWEGSGVIPDIVVAADSALAAAREDILTKQLAMAATDREKKEIQWAKNLLVAQLHQGTMDSAQLAAYTGTFKGGLRFFVKDNNLYCQNAQRGNVTVKLQHVNKDLFILDDNIQIGFKKDETGQFSGIQWYRADGTESFREKEIEK